MNSPKILIFDIETIPMITANFTLYPSAIHHQNILQDWSIVSIAWKYYKQTKVHSYTVLNEIDTFNVDPCNDIHVVDKLRTLINDADIVITHNGDKFDLKKFMARIIYHNLEPLHRPHSVDTLKEIKKIAQFSSHRLDYLGQHLLGRGKLETSQGLWLRVLRGDPAAVREMATYNEEDVVLLEEFYERILPYIKSHPHVGAIAGHDRHLSCPKCGSTDLHVKAYRTTAAGIEKVQKQCNNCGSYHTFAK